MYCGFWLKILALIWEMAGFGRLDWGVSAAIVRGVNGVAFWAKMAWSGVV